MKTLALSTLTITGLLLVSSCRTTHYNTEPSRAPTITTTTEETTLRRTPQFNAPVSTTTTATQTARRY